MKNENCNNNQEEPEEMKGKKPKEMDGKEWICRPWITLKNGQRLYAKSVGKKAFCFWAKPKVQ